MTNRLPPVPPAGRSPKGPGDQTVPPKDTAGSGGRSSGASANLKEQGQPGNIAQNTTHQGYQQDR